MRLDFAAAHTSRPGLSAKSSGSANCPEWERAFGLVHITRARDPIKATRGRFVVGKRGADRRTSPGVIYYCGKAVGLFWCGRLGVGLFVCLFVPEFAVDVLSCGFIGRGGAPRLLQLVRVT